MHITEDWVRYLREVQTYQKKWPEVRKGQCFYTVASIMFPELVYTIDSAYDPYYVEANLPMFLKKLNLSLQGIDDPPQYVCPFCGGEVKVEYPYVFPDGMITAMGYCGRCREMVETEGD